MVQLFDCFIVFNSSHFSQRDAFGKSFKNLVIAVNLVSPVILAIFHFVKISKIGDFTAYAMVR